MSNKVTWTPGQIQLLWDQLETKPMAQLGDDRGVSASTDFSGSLTAANVGYTTSRCDIVAHHFFETGS